MEFHCRLGSASGEIVEGVYVAEDEAKLRQRLGEKGLYVLSLQPKGTLGSIGISLPQRRRVKAREFIVFNQELATLLNAGMPVVQSLDILRQRVESPVFRSVLDDVHDRVRSGTALSDAFATHGDLFPGVYTASLMAGEKSGSLEEVLRRYVAYSQVVGTIRRKTISALIYPTILLALSLIVVGIIVLRVVPEFGNFYEGLGADLPASTRAIVATSEAVRGNFLTIILVIAGGAALGWAWFRQPGRRATLDRFLLEVPGAGGIARKFATSQLARTLSTLLRGGIPLVSALDVAAKAIGNRYFSQQLGTVSREVREGQALSTTLSGRGIFPPVAVKMVEVGESTGALQEMLSSVADFFDEEIETALSRFMVLIEPILLVIMGVIIAGLLLAMYMPLIQLGSIGS